MAGTSGLCSDTNGVAQLAIAALNGGTALAITTPLKIAALSVVRTANNGSDTEWATAAGYTAAPAPGTGGAGTTGWAFPAMNAAAANTTGAQQTNSAAATLTNAPAGTWAGNRIQDSSATNNKNIWYGTIGTSKTIALGDSCTLPATTGIVTQIG
jgi:hypothetical protein